jgi:predicted nucleic acid-binding protein
MIREETKYYDNKGNEYISCIQLESKEWELTTSDGNKKLFSEDKKTILFDGYWYMSLKQLESKEWEITDSEAYKWLFSEDKQTKLFNGHHYNSFRQLESGEFEITDEDYIQAARFFNICRKNGIQGSHIDFLICSVAHRLKAQIFTSDNDFVHYQKYVPIQLFIFQSQS